MKQYKVLAETITKGRMTLRKDDTVNENRFDAETLATLVKNGDLEEVVGVKTKPEKTKP